MQMKERVDFCIIVPPAGATKTIYPPYGSMYIASALRGKGFHTRILNVDLERMSNATVTERIREINPKYIGFSGIVAPSYKYIKNLSSELRNVFHDKIQILGGGLAAAVEPIFQNTAIDIIVQGEGDLTIVEVMDCLGNNKDLSSVRGIYYREGTSYNYTGKRSLIANLDSLPYPAFDLIDMDKYMPDGVEFTKDPRSNVSLNRKIYDPKRSRKMITIPTSRGCFGECSFCFRAYKGIRVHSMKYVFDFIEYCIDKFNVGFFSFGDECFAPNKSRNWAFIEEYKKRKMDFIFRIIGMRVDTVDQEILRAYREIGCWMIEYGFESGSQKILDIMNKMVTVEQNRQVALWTKEAGIFTSPALVLGMPGETNQTVQETINFVKSLDFGFKQYQYTYALPIPGSALYEYAKIAGAIDNEDEYLSSLEGEVSGAHFFHVNVSDEPDHVVTGWGEKLKNELDIAFFYSRHKNLFIAKLMCLIAKISLLYQSGTLLKILARRVRTFFASLLHLKQPSGPQKGHGRFRKKGDIQIEAFLKSNDPGSPDHGVPLKIINQRLRIGDTKFEQRDATREEAT